MMATTALAPARRRTATRTVLLAGIVGGGFDAAYAVIYFGLTRGVSSIRIFQHVASGLLGRVSFSLGWKSFLLGLTCHFVIAIGAATTYAVASSRIPALVKNPLLYGPMFGLGIYGFMNFVVIPLSRIVPRSGPAPLDVVITGILVHMFLIGYPIALILSRGGRSVQ